MGSSRIATSCPWPTRRAGRCPSLLQQPPQPQAGARCEGHQGDHGRLDAAAAPCHTGATSRVESTAGRVGDGGEPTLRVARELSPTIPIVMAASRDPVGSGLVVSLARPGGNLTGLSILGVQLTSKRLELLKETVPSTSRVAILGARPILSAHGQARERGQHEHRGEPKGEARHGPRSKRRPSCPQSPLASASAPAAGRRCAWLRLGARRTAALLLGIAVAATVAESSARKPCAHMQLYQPPEGRSIVAARAAAPHPEPGPERKEGSDMRRLIMWGLLAILAVGSTGVVYAAVGQPRTAGTRYDRNPSVLQDGPITYLFFARTQAPCNRLAGATPCNPDVADYDLYYKASTDGGQTFGPDTFVAANPDGPGGFYGRTVAATHTLDGTVYVFWASGGNSTLLYYVRKAPSSPTFTAPLAVAGVPPTIFNIEAVAAGSTVYLYSEECCSAPGIYARTFNGIAAGPPTLVALNKNLPKVIVDNQGQFRMAMTDASAYPTVDVYTSSSADGLTWTPPALTVHRPGVSHWDPSLAQRPNGHYYLFFAPDRQEGLGRQRIGVTTSNDFVRWAAPRDVSPGVQARQEYWDYWPEGFVLGNKLILFYTSERGLEAGAGGTGHIWTLPGQGGLD